MNCRYNKDEFKYVIGIIRKYDKYKLGRLLPIGDSDELISIDSPEKFNILLRGENVEEGYGSSKERFYDGNPNIENMFDSEGHVTSE